MAVSDRFFANSCVNRIDSEDICTARNVLFQPESNHKSTRKAIRRRITIWARDEYMFWFYSHGHEVRVEQVHTLTVESVSKNDRTLGGKRRVIKLPPLRLCGIRAPSGKKASFSRSSSSTSSCTSAVIVEVGGFTEDRNESNNNHRSNKNLR